MVNHLSKKAPLVLLALGVFATTIFTMTTPLVQANTGFVNYNKELNSLVTIGYIVGFPVIFVISMLGRFGFESYLPQIGYSLTALWSFAVYKFLVYKLSPNWN